LWFRQADDRGVVMEDQMAKCPERQDTPESAAILIGRSTRMDHHHLDHHHLLLVLLLLPSSARSKLSYVKTFPHFRRFMPSGAPMSIPPGTKNLHLTFAPKIQVMKQRVSKCTHRPIGKFASGSSASEIVRAR
jgi:hypothetical protein